MQNAIYDKAKEYLEDRKKVLDGLVKTVGYKNCFHIESLDASKCADDCKNQEKSEFAKNCTENGGLFKCCIRRDKMGCNDCRFCCTLPMCTYSPGYKANTFFDMEQKIELKTQENEQRADEIFFSDQHLYKTDDYRCLKPESHEDPEKWHTYEVKGFREAFNKEQLENTRTYKYDKYLYNWEDPKIFKAFTKNEKKARNIWKKSYKFHYTGMIPGGDANSNLSANTSWTNMTKCVKKCIKLEHSKFAKKCKKEGGYFKCCNSVWLLRTYEQARNQLIKEGLIKADPTHMCDRTSMKDRCVQCSVTAICTVKNPVNGKITQYFYSKMKKESKMKEQSESK